MVTGNSGKRGRTGSATRNDHSEPPLKRHRDRKNEDRRFEVSQRRAFPQERERSRSPVHRHPESKSSGQVHDDLDDINTGGNSRQSISSGGASRRNRSRSRERHRRKDNSFSRRRTSRSPSSRNEQQGRRYDQGLSGSNRGVNESTARQSKQNGSESAANRSGLEEPDAEIRLMKNTMGFSKFRSTKNTKVPGNNVGAVRKSKQIEARQYMNRVGGFNRPLSPGR